jgi:hypothetical protein
MIAVSHPLTASTNLGQLKEKISMPNFNSGTTFVLKGKKCKVL